MHCIRAHIRCNAHEKFIPISHSLFTVYLHFWYKMRTLLVTLCLLVVVYCQTQHKNGNPTGEIGQPAFDEIIVESTLTVRGKSGSRGGKSLITNSKPKEAETNVKEETVNGASVLLNRNRRESRQRFGGFDRQNLGSFPNGPLGSRFPGSSASAAHASSNAFNSNTPFGSFGASASQSSSQSQNFGPNGFQGAAGQSASQTYYLPNGSRIDISFSNSYSIDKGRPTSSNSHSLTFTDPNGRINRVRP